MLVTLKQTAYSLRHFQMNNLVKANDIPSMSEDAVSKVCEFEDSVLKEPQTQIETSHTFHAGMYARSITLPANTVLTGALIKIPTLIIVEGEVQIYTGEKLINLIGYNVLKADAFRKQIFIAKTDTNITMIFPTKTTIVETAEEEFTDEASRLMSRKEEQSESIGINL